MLSIDESIQKMKAEIIAQDWNLPQKRIEQLELAFACLKQRFNSRKNALAILTMGDNILQYIKKKGRVTSPDFIDFMKEAMAHIVNIYEDSKFDPEAEEKLFKRMYSRYTFLRRKVETAGSSSKVKTQASVLRQAQNKPTGAPLARENSSLEAAEAVPSPQLNRQVTAGDPDKTWAAGRRRNTPRPQSEWTPADGSPVRQFCIGNMQLGILEEHIALLRTVSPKKRKRYLKTTQIPLKDFSKFLRKLSSQFKGELAGMKDSALKGINLPLVIPKGVGLLNMPDEHADYLLVLTSGQRHGIIFCADLQGETRIMQRFQKGKNGDIAGLAFLDDEKTVPLLNTFSILEREGFLSLPA